MAFGNRSYEVGINTVKVWMSSLSSCLWWSWEHTDATYMARRVLGESRRVCNWTKRAIIAKENVCNCRGEHDRGRVIRRSEIGLRWREGKKGRRGFSICCKMGKKINRGVFKYCDVGNYDSGVTERKKSIFLRYIEISMCVYVCLCGLICYICFLFVYLYIFVEIHITARWNDLTCLDIKQSHIFDL